MSDAAKDMIDEDVVIVTKAIILGFNTNGRFRIDVSSGVDPIHAHFMLMKAARAIEDSLEPTGPKKSLVELVPGTVLK